MISRARGRPGLRDHARGAGQLVIGLSPAPLGKMPTQSWTRRGPRTLTSRKALLAELERVRRTGVAVNDEELESALRSIAAPVRSRSGEVVAAINVAIPWSPAAMNELVSRLGPAVQAAANEIAARVI